MIAAKIIQDSISPAGVRLTSIQVTAHRFILAEINTHRQLSRNYRSSRAVPTARLIAEVRQNPAMPVFWGKNQPGMQAREELEGNARVDAEECWRRAAAAAADQAEQLAGTGAHKQIVNRLIEPFLYVPGLITATEWTNFFALRCHPDAQPEFKVLAEAMRDAMAGSRPELTDLGDWHLPYVDTQDLRLVADVERETTRSTGEKVEAAKSVLLKLSAARCARVSYRVFDADRRPTIEEDIDLANRLAASGHWSPFEHVATPDVRPGLKWANRRLHGNFVGWCQHRKMMPGECR
ncbi:MAG: FAD-dependent thymidylate synthase [Alphaproteobacteria bacterium]|nr:FAD-dependent thymidylate synthase [Alphaproteobacteria bacterium]